MADLHDGHDGLEAEGGLMGKMANMRINHLRDQEIGMMADMHESKRLYGFQ